ncbi:unnamed protein product [Calypogeia fissa]
MGNRLDGRVSLLMTAIIALFCLEDSAHFHVEAGRSGPGGRIPQASDPKKDDRKAPSQDQQSIPTPQSYKSNAELLAAMADYQSRCSKISRIYTIGKSVKGVPLTVLEISDFPGQYEPEPAFKYVGNMHGDEPSGRELLLYLAEWLCTNYLKEPKDPMATFIVENIHLHLLPSMNPDGYDRRTRNNANDVDLNRDFPDQYNPINNVENGRQPETLAIMKWIRNIPFTASASLHEGALVASYGWDGTVTGRTGYSETPDDAAFRHMASLYSQNNPVMKSSSEFLGGITNGASWYPLYGGMQDWNYIHGNCFEITIEMVEDKSPNISKIPELWQQHQQSLLELAASVAKTGVHGRVMSAVDGSPLQAKIVVKGNDKGINASATLGDYHRILPPNPSSSKNYELTAKFPGYISRQTTVVLSPWKATTLDFVLEPLPRKDAAPIQVPCVKQELAYHCAGARVAKGIGPWLPRQLVKNLDHQDMVSTVHVELFFVITAGTVVVVVAVAFFALARRRRSLTRGQSIRYQPMSPSSMRRKP